MIARIHKGAMALAVTTVVVAAFVWSTGRAQPVSAEVTRLAQDVLSDIQAQSFVDGVEYCGLIALDGAGVPFATVAVPGEPYGCDLPDDPPGSRVVASYHTHGSFDPEAASETPSSDDMIGDFAEGFHGFVSTPGGRFWHIDPISREAHLICGVGCLPADPAFRPCRGKQPKTRYTIRELQQREASDFPAC